MDLTPIMLLIRRPVPITFSRGVLRVKDIRQATFHLQLRLKNMNISSKEQERLLAEP